MSPPDAVETFIARWQDVTASELATAQTFVIDLCAMLGVAPPHATAGQDYMFERPVSFRHGDGSSSPGRIDCYRRGHFVLEAKKLKAAPGGAAKVFDDSLLRARSQAENYARALPSEEGRPPFLIVVDVGNVIELYAEFSQTGGTYLPYPDPRSHRIRLADLRDEALRQRLAAVWRDPQSLDPARRSARVTREIAAHLAEVAKSLEHAGQMPPARSARDAFDDVVGKQVQREVVALEEREIEQDAGAANGELEFGHARPAIAHRG